MSYLFEPVDACDSGVRVHDAPELEVDALLDALLVTIGHVGAGCRGGQVQSHRGGIWKKKWETATH